MRRTPCLRNTAAAALAAALLALGCQTLPEDVLATYEGGRVEVEELDALLRDLPESQRQPGGGQSMEEWTEERIRDLALREVLLGRAREAGLDEDPAILLRARFVASQEVGRAHLYGRCPEEAVDEDRLRQIHDLQSREPEEWILVRHIYKQAPQEDPAARAAARQEMEDLLDQLQAGGSFIELARLHSDSETAGDGGLIGRISRRAPMVREALETAWSLRDGQMSEVVAVADGFHILLREDSGVEEPRSFEEVREQLARQAVLQKREACSQRVFAELAADRPVEIVGGELRADWEEEDEVIRVGEESFTLGELRGLSPDRTPLTHNPQPLPLLRRFAEALLLAAAATAEDPATEDRYQEIRQAALERALLEAQFQRERRELAASWSEEELREAYDARPERFQTELILDLGVILLAGEPGAGRRPVLARGENLAERLAAGADFEALAREWSEHPSREEGGRLGPLPFSQLGALLGARRLEAVAGLEEGETAGPLLLRSSPQALYLLVRVYDRVEPRQLSFQEARDEVVEVLARERVRELETAVRGSLLDSVDFRLHGDAVERYLGAAA